MSVKKSIDKTVTALENGKTRIIKLYDFVSGLSVKNKASFDIQLKSDSFFAPLCRHGFSYNKEFKIMPLILGTAGVLFLMTIVGAIASDKE